jgi:hypothetical protein
MHPDMLDVCHHTFSLIADGQPINEIAVRSALVLARVGPFAPLNEAVRKLYRNRLRITSSVNVSMPQSVWWITNHSFVPSSL